MYEHARADEMFTVANPRGIPAAFPVIEVADGRAFYEGDTVEGSALSARTIQAWVKSGIIRATGGVDDG